MSFEIKKHFFKLINNSFYGKTVKTKISSRLVNNAKKYKAYKNKLLG